MPGLSGWSPLVGINDPRFGARFVSLHEAYDKSLRSELSNKRRFLSASPFALKRKIVPQLVLGR